MSRSGSAIGAKLDGYSRQARQGIITSAPGGKVTPGAVTSAFPRDGLGSEDYRRDEILRMKQEMIQEGTGLGQTRLGQVQLSDDDILHLQKKQEAEVEADFDAWAGANFHTHDPAMRRWFQQIYPRYYKIRDEKMINKAKFALRVNRLLEHGPQDEEDLLLQWGLSTGLIELEPGWDVIGYHEDNPDMGKQQNKFASRLMGQRRYKSAIERSTAANTLDARGNHVNPFYPRTPAEGQVPAPFSGMVAKDKRYTAFMDRILQNPQPRGAGAGAPAPAAPVGRN